MKTRHKKEFSIIICPSATQIVSIEHITHVDVPAVHLLPFPGTVPLLVLSTGAVKMCCTALGRPDSCVLRSGLGGATQKDKLGVCWGSKLNSGKDVVPRLSPHQGRIGLSICLAALALRNCL